MTVYPVAGLSVYTHDRVALQAVRGSLFIFFPSIQQGLIENRAHSWPARGWGLLITLPALNKYTVIKVFSLLGHHVQLWRLDYAHSSSSNIFKNEGNVSRDRKLLMRIKEAGSFSLNLSPICTRPRGRICTTRP